jgi:hypothetical protein
MANVDQAELKKDIEAIAADIFSEKEEAEMRKKTEEALQNSANVIEDLTNTLEERNGEVEVLEAKVTEKEEWAVSLEAELEAAKQEVESLNQKVSEVENEMNEMKKDKAADIRMAELEEAGVVSSNREVQVAKIREMSDEEFASYKEELVSVRTAVLKEIEAAKAKNEETTEEASETEEAEEEEASTSEETEEETEETEEDYETEEEIAPAQIDPSKAVQAAMNMDVFVTNDMAKKYSELGQAMAESFKVK